MKILVLAADWMGDVLGGGVVAIYHTCRCLAEKGHEVEVVAVANELSQECIDKIAPNLTLRRVYFSDRGNALKHARKGSLGKVIWHLRDYFSFENKVIIRKLIDEIKPDVINVQNLIGMGFNVLPLIEESNIPTVYTMHEYGLACLYTSLFKHGKPCSRTLFSCAECRFVSSLRMHFLRKLRNFGIIANSLYTYQKVCEHLSLPPHKHCVIHYPIRFDKESRLPKASTTVMFLFVGRLHHTKGIGFLLDILSELAGEFEFNIRVAGDGPQRLSLEERFGKESWCQFLGAVPNEKISKLMVTADFLCVPSLWAEPFGIVAQHSRALGVPVLCSDTGGVCELVSHGRNGMTIATGNKAEWKSCIKRILTEEALRVQLSDGAMESSAEIDSERATAQTIEFFQTIIDWKRSLSGR